MWETVAHAVRQGARYAAVHGVDCAKAPNSCPVTVGQIAQEIKNAGVGLDADQLQVTISIVLGGTYPGTVVVGDGPQTLTNLLADMQAFSAWQAGGADAAVVTNDVIVVAKLPFSSGLAMFWPGAGAPVSFSVVNLSANSRERILF